MTKGIKKVMVLDPKEESEKGFLAFRVQDNDGNRISRALVRVWRTVEDTNPDSELASTHTNEDGWAVIEDVPVDDLDVWIGHADFKTNKSTIRETDFEEKSKPDTGS